MTNPHLASENGDGTDMLTEGRDHEILVEGEVIPISSIFEGNWKVMEQDGLKKIGIYRYITLISIFITLVAIICFRAG